MADIIDSFVVSLGLDPSQYNREIKKYKDDRKKLAEEEDKYNKSSQEAQKRNIEGIRALSTETAGFLLVLAGASSVAEFAKNLINTDDATGKLAANLNIATEELSTWEAAARAAGGTTQGIDNAIRSMSAAYQSLKLTGTTGHDADLNALGVRPGASPTEMLLQLSAAANRPGMDRAQYRARLGRLGIGEDEITLLARGRPALEAYLEAHRKLGVETAKNAEEARKFNEEIADLETAIMAKARPAIEAFAETVGKWLANTEHLNAVLEIAEVALIAIAAAAAAASWPFLLLAGAIVVVINNLDKLRAMAHTVATAMDPVLDPIRKALGLKTGAQADKDHTDIFGNPVGGGGSPGAPAAGAASGAGGGGAPGNSGAIQKYLQSKGLSPQAAAGMVASMRAENSTLDPNKANPTSGAYGLGQWLGARKKALFARYPGGGTWQQQVDFMLSEMHGGDAGATKGAGGVFGAASARDASHAMVTSFYRPGAGTQGDFNRADAALGLRPGMTARPALARAGGGGSTTTIGAINVYTKATDAAGIAKDLPGELSRRGVVQQADTGLRQ